MNIYDLTKSKYIILLIAFLSLYGCAAIRQPGTEHDQKSNSEILVGKVSVANLKKKPYGEWFKKNYKDYQVDESSLEQIKSKNLLSDTKVLIVMGTWCKDSKREVPRFVKIMKKTGYHNFEIVCVNRAKKITVKEFEQIEVDHIPDFIFLKNGREIGRIVESPVQSLEADMIKILTNNK